MALPFDPEQLTPSASLNRLILGDLPGIGLEADVRGKTAYEVLSARALADRPRPQAGLLGLGAAGVGFPPATNMVRPVAPHLNIAAM